MISIWVFSMSEMRGERLQVMLSPEELTAIDDFRFRHRMPTRAAAVRELLKLGLTALASDGGRMKFSNYGVQPRSRRTHVRLRSGPGGVGRRQAEISRAEISAPRGSHRRIAPGSI